MSRGLFFTASLGQQSLPLTRNVLSVPVLSYIGRDTLDALLATRSWILMAARKSRIEPNLRVHTPGRSPDENQQIDRKQHSHKRQPRRRSRKGLNQQNRKRLLQVLEPRPSLPLYHHNSTDAHIKLAGGSKKPPGPPKPPPKSRKSNPPAVRKPATGPTRGGQKSARGGKVRAITLMPGDGIGPEISLSVLEVLKAVGAPLVFEPVDVAPVIDSSGKQSIPQAVIDSMSRTKLGLKGPLMTPVGKGFRSLNLTLRVLFNLYANVRPCRSLDGVETVYGKVDIITIRENTEGEYSGIEHTLVNGVVQSIKLITRNASLRVAEYGFKYALAMKRKKITAVHKRSYMRMSDGLFIDCARQMYKKYKDQMDKQGIKYEEVDISTICLKVVEDPTQFDVLIMPNLYGDIMSDTCAGLIGGLGLTPSGNIGINGAIFEAVHGTAPDIAGKDLANPTALLLSTVMMLRYIDMGNYADKIERAILKTIKEDNVRTMDLGGKAKCSEYTRALIRNLK